MAGLDLEAIKAERARLQAAYLTPDRPATSARGIHHAALICSDVEQTIEFYQGILEFRSPSCSATGTTRARPTSSLT